MLGDRKKRRRLTKLIHSLHHPYGGLCIRNRSVIVGLACRNRVRYLKYVESDSSCSKTMAAAVDKGIYIYICLHTGPIEVNLNVL